jgi:hypothetical protein
MTLVSDPAHPAALLKTAERTYSLVQKNTSNSLMILQPTVGAVDHGDEGPDNGSNAQHGLDIITTVGETFELVPSHEVAPLAKRASTRGKWHEKFGRNR